MKSGLALLAVTFLPACCAADLSLDELVRRHVDAMGGAERLSAVRSLRMSGKAITAGGQFEALLSITIKKPDKMRSELIVMGQSIVSAFDGVTAWRSHPLDSGGEPKKLGDAEKGEIAEQAEFAGPLFDYKEKGHKPEIEGQEEIEGAPAYKVRITRRGGRVDYVWIDAESFLIVKTEIRRTQGGQERVIESWPGDYRKVDGILFPFLSEQKSAGQTLLSISIDKIELNPEIGDATFVMR